MAKHSTSAFGEKSATRILSDFLEQKHTDYLLYKSHPLDLLPFLSDFQFIINRILFFLRIQTIKTFPRSKPILQAVPIAQFSH